MHSKFIWILLILLLSVSGCASGSSVKKAPPGTSLSSMTDDVLIFGRIKWVQNGKAKDTFSGLYGSFNVDLRVLRAEDMKTSTIFKIEEDGRFYALLPTGTYVIYRIEWADFWGSGRFQPKVAFKVPEGNRSYYLGTLNLDVVTKRNIFGSQIVKEYYISIDDEESNAMVAFHRRYGSQNIRIIKALMVHDKDIPTMKQLDRRQLLLEILNSLQFGKRTIQ